MILEDQGVRIQAFKDLHERAVADVRTIHDSCERFRSVLYEHGLRTKYSLSPLLKRIEEDFGIGLILANSSAGFDTAFLRQIRDVSMIHVLRNIKFNARILIPNSYHLVDVADEGPTYEAAGQENIFTLPENHIYGSHLIPAMYSLTQIFYAACVQRSNDSEPIWLEGSCTISRSPVAHPGDGKFVFV